MSSIQKVIKYLAIVLAIFIIVSIISGIISLITGISIISGLVKNNDNISEEVELISEDLEKSEIVILDLDIAYSNIKIKQGKEFKVESNNSSISCKENNDKLIIKEEKNHWFSNSKLSELIIYVPEKIVFDKVDIESGAGEVEIERLETKQLDFEIGAGKVKIENLIVSDEARITGGAGKVEILDGKINDLDLDMGAGKFSLISKLTGNNKIDQGIGKLDINLTDGLENYTINVNKGIGSITIGGKEAKDNEKYGKGNTTIKIDGGVGAVEIK